MSLLWLYLYACQGSPASDARGQRGFFDCSGPLVGSTYFTWPPWAKKDGGSNLATLRLGQSRHCRCTGLLLKGPPPGLVYTLL